MGTADSLATGSALGRRRLENFKESVTPRALVAAFAQEATPQRPAAFGERPIVSRVVVPGPAALEIHDQPALVRAGLGGQQCQRLGELTGLVGACTSCCVASRSELAYFPVRYTRATTRPSWRTVTTSRPSRP